MASTQAAHGSLTIWKHLGHRPQNGVSASLRDQGRWPTGLPLACPRASGPAPGRTAAPFSVCGDPVFVAEQ